jgi:hypothetical protein
MRTLMLVALALAFAAPAAAQKLGPDGKPALSIQCVEVSGRAIPPLCHVPGSRIDPQEYICTCPAGGQRVDVPVCGSGQHPPRESAKFERFRATASRDGSLVGDAFEGQQICVAQRHE